MPQGGLTLTLFAGLGAVAYTALEAAEQLAQPDHRSPVTLALIAAGYVTAAAALEIAALLAGVVLNSIGALVVVLTRVLVTTIPLPARRAAWARPRPLASYLQATARQRRGPPAGAWTTA